MRMVWFGSWIYSIGFAFALATSSIWAQDVQPSIDAVAPKTNVSVVTRCALRCSAENETYILSLIRSPSLRMQVAQLYAKQFPLQEESAQYTDWASRLAMPGVVEFNPETKVVTFTVAAETFEEAQTINHTYVALCRKTIEEQNRAYTDRATKTILSTIRADIHRENEHLQGLLDQPSSTRVKLQREDSIQRLKMLNRQLQYAEETMRQQATTLEVLVD